MSDDKPTVSEDITNEAPAVDTAEPEYVPLDMDFGLTAAVDAEAVETEVEPEITAEDVEEVDPDGELPEVEEGADEDADAEAAAPETVPEGDEPAEEESELSDEEPDEGLAATKAPKKKKSPMVPKARLDEVLAKQRDLQKQLDSMNAATEAVAEQAADTPPEYDFDAKELQYQELVLDGEGAKAVALRHEIRQAERDSIRAEMKQDMSQTVTQDRTANALQQAADNLEDNFPVFNAKSEDYNEALTQEVIDLRDAFIIKGDSPVEALGKAASYVIKDNGLYDPADETSLADEPAAKVDEVARKRKQVSKKMKVAGQQPPTLPETSEADPEARIDINNLTDEEFESLPEKTLARMRGDII
jgi:hypothetical protein